jgi:hypothetical protein
MVNYRLEDLANWMGNETLQDAVGNEDRDVSYDIQAVLDIEPTEEVVMEADGTYLVTLYLPNLEADDISVILHYQEEIGGWEWIIPEHVEAGKITFRTESFSPFAVSTIVIRERVVISTMVSLPTQEESTPARRFFTVLGREALEPILAWLMLCVVTAISLYLVWRRKDEQELPEGME